MTTRPLRVGVDYLPCEGEAGQPAPSWPQMLECVQLAEAVGFDSIWVPDHLQHHEQEMYTHFGVDIPDEMRDIPAFGWWESWTVLTAIAYHTSSIRLGPLVACTNNRNPALLAKMAATLDEISNGRLVLGVGAGDALGEMRSNGFPTNHLVSRFEEAVQIICDMIRTGESTLAGKWYETAGAEMRLTGPQRAGLPIMISAKGPRMLEITAKLADRWNAWLCYGANDVTQYARLADRLDAACDAINRDPASIERSAGLCVVMHDDIQIPGVTPIRGEAEQIAEQLHAFVAAGVAEVQLLIEPGGKRGLEAFAPVLEMLGRA